MRTKRLFKSIGMALCLMCLGSLIAACGGGGGGSSSDSTAAPSGTGSVAVLVTDGPSAEVEALILTINKISLIPAGNGEAVVIYDDPQPDTINVLNYKSKEEPYFLTLKNEVPAGHYTKIRLEIENIAVEGGPCADQNIKLPSGKIDLNPRGGFYVNEGESIAIQLDFDANKWFNLHEAGNSGKCILRPVIFVDIATIGLQQRCPKIIKGTIEAIDRSEDGNTRFQLKPAGHRGTLWVIVDDGTVIIDENGASANESILQKNDTVHVRGRLTRDGILASLVVEGDVLKVHGTSNGAVQNDDAGLFFPFTLDSGEELIGTFKVRVSEDTLVLLDCNTPGSLENIGEHTQATVIAKFSAEKGLMAAAILIETAEVKGELTEINDPQSPETSYQFVIQKGDGTSETIGVPPNTPIHLVGDGPLQIADLKQLVNTCEVYPSVRVLLDTATPDTQTALQVLVYPEEITGTVFSVDTTDSIIVLTVAGVNKKIKVDGSAKIYKSGEDSQDLLLEDIAEGDTVTVFGIPACTADPEDADFIAYAVVLNGWN